MSEQVLMFADELFESWEISSRSDLDKAQAHRMHFYYTPVLGPTGSVQEDPDHALPTRPSG